MKAFAKTLLLFSSLIALNACVVVRQGEVAMKRRAGKLVGQPITETTRVYNPLWSTYIKVPVRNINLEVALDIPSKEGLTIRSEVSILYRLDPEQVPNILRDVGIQFERNAWRIMTHRVHRSPSSTFAITAPSSRGVGGFGHPA